MTLDQNVPNDLLIPPQRLGSLLAGARVKRGYTVAEAARALGAPWDPVHLLEVETGQRLLFDSQICELATLYGVDTSALVPDRTHLVIDVDDALMRTGDHVVDLRNGDRERREVLGRYLALLYTVRQIPPGQTMPLRAGDLDVLSGFLAVAHADLEDELERMMLDGGSFVRSRSLRFRNRVVLPAVGVIVAVTTAGLLLLVGADDADGSTSVPPASGAAAVGDGSDADPAASEVEIGQAVVQERDEHGRPGPVVPRD